MKKLLFTAFAAALIVFAGKSASAQDYKNALGVRLGSYNGVNFKTFISATNALDFNLSFRNNNARKSVFLTGLYEIHNPIQNAPGLKWYYGAGASLGSWKYKNSDIDSDLFLSADGVLGLDYKFSGTPINIAVDWRPRLVITPDTDVTAGDVGVAIRFTF